MEIKDILVSSLRVAWIAGSRPKTLNRVSVQKVNIQAISNEIKAKKLTLSRFGILMQGLCVIYNRVIQFLYKDTCEMLKLDLEKPRRSKKNQVDMIVSNVKARNPLRFSLGGMHMILDAPPVIENSRKGPQSKAEDITFAEASKRFSLQRDSFGIDLFFEQTLIQESVNIESTFNFNIPDTEIETPPLTPNRPIVLLNPNATTIKRKPKRKIKLEDKDINLSDEKLKS